MSNATQSVAAARINSLLDANSFVEIGQAVTARTTDFNMTEKKAPSDGVITGYGVIDGSLVYVYSQDASVLNGTVGEMHAKKIAKCLKCIGSLLKTKSRTVYKTDNRCSNFQSKIINFGDLFGIRCYSTDHCCFRNMRRWNGSCTGSYRLYICRGEEGQTVCKHSKCAGGKQSGKMRFSFRTVPE